MKLFITLLFCCFLLSCSFFHKEEDHLSATVMKKVLADMHVADVYSTMVGRDSVYKGQDKNLDSLAHYYKEILAHYHLTEKDFSVSIDWYRSHPEQLDSVYNTILAGMVKK